MSKPDLWPHQKKTLELYRNSPRVFDLSDPGTGKTRAALEAFAERREAGGKRALIIAPKTLLESAWGEDSDKFTPQLSYSCAYAENREEAFSVAADMYITNTDAVRWLKLQPASFWKSFDTLIIDESSAFKHRKSQRSIAMRKLAKHFKYRALLTGTPTSLSVTDIHHQVRILDDGKRLGGDFEAFRNVVCTPELRDPREPRSVVWVDRPQAYETVQQILKDVVIAHEFHKVMTHVPKGTEQFIRFTPNQRHMERYTQLAEQCRLELEEGTVNAVNAAALRQKLLQMASGSVYGEEGVLVLDKQRVELVADLVSERKHSIVFYSWDHQREQLMEHMKKRGIKCAEITRQMKGPARAEVVRDYQAGKYQTLIMHPQTGAHGLTLTRGTSTIWCSPTDRADLLVQGKHRVLRGSQTEVTQNLMVCARGTVDERAYDGTTRKRDAMTDLMELMRNG